MPRKKKPKPFKLQPLSRLPVEPIDLSIPWYVIVTGPQKERRVKERFDEIGIATMLPLIGEDRIIRHRKVHVTLPLYRPYLFVGFQGNRFGEAKAVKDVMSFLPTEGDPLPIRSSVLREIIELHNARTAIDRSVLSRFSIDALVRICDGPFAGFNGHIKSIDALDALVETSLFGRITPVTLGIEQIEPVS